MNLASSLVAIAANIALQPDPKGNAFRSLGGRIAVVKILTEAASQLAELERNRAGAPQEP